MKHIEDEKPDDGFYYLVYAANYCESGYQVAEYSKGKFTTESGDDITKYVTCWSELPVIPDF